MEFQAHRQSDVQGAAIALTSVYDTLMTPLCFFNPDIYVCFVKSVLDAVRSDVDSRPGKQLPCLLADSDSVSRLQANLTTAASSHFSPFHADGG